MGPFNIRLTREELDALEDVRKTLGARSKAEVIRHWIKLATAKKEAK